MIQLVYHTSSSPAIHSISLLFSYKDAMGNYLQRLAKIKVNAIHCTPLMYRASHLIIESNQADSAQFALKQYNFIFILNFIFKFWDEPTTFSDTLPPTLFHCLSSNISLTWLVFILKAGSATQDSQVSFTKTQKLSWQSSWSYLAQEHVKTSLKRRLSRGPSPSFVNSLQASQAERHRYES